MKLQMPVLICNRLCSPSAHEHMLTCNIIKINVLQVHPEMKYFKLHCEQSSLSQRMRFWYLSHRRSAKAQASLCIRAVPPEPSLFAHMKYGSRRRVQPKIRHLAPLDAAPARLKNEFTEDGKCHNLTRWLSTFFSDNAFQHYTSISIITIAHAI